MEKSAGTADENDAEIRAEMVGNSSITQNEVEMLEDMPAKEDSQSEEYESSTESPIGSQSSEMEENGDQSSDSCSRNSSDDTDRTRYCLDCGYKSTRKANYDRHMRTMHEELEIPLACCELLFTTKAAKIRHVREVHGKGYDCPYPKCAKRFNRRALLVRHFAVHTGVKPFACQDCTYASNHRSNLKRHQLTCKAKLMKLQLRGEKCKTNGVKEENDIEDDELQNDSTNNVNDIANSTTSEYSSLPSPSSTCTLSEETERASISPNNNDVDLPTNPHLQNDSSEYHRLDIALPNSTNHAESAQIDQIDNNEHERNNQEPENAAPLDLSVGKLRINAPPIENPFPIFVSPPIPNQFLQSPQFYPNYPHLPYFPPMYPHQQFAPIPHQQFTPIPHPPQLYPFPVFQPHFPNFQYGTNPFNQYKK